ncbi:MAG TPA: L-histidine N(alpha)-methyltransferase [Sporichthyaceae bacterium]|jgi:L-histidine N-alpha-methyltransferase|nr:L-histidine N(alpha)-methyltransferase [Sporichthyaceae bacterium]
MTLTAHSRLVVEERLPADFVSRSLRDDVRRGLTERPRTLPPKWFYDNVGSDLFTEITRLPEYYPTRAEREILQREADRIARYSDASTVVELGSGSSEKTRLLLDALDRRGTLRRYVAVDVSAEALLDAATDLLGDYPGLHVHAVVADFESQLHLLPVHDGPRLFVFLGGTIGNFEPSARARFLRALAAGMRPADRLLLGTDLVKSPAVLVPAYDDAAGVTAKFNRNVLAVLNRELDADFDVDSFEHLAVWDDRAEWIEMRLRTPVAQRVRIPAVDLVLDLAAGEEIRTEISAKFRPQGVRAELASAGLDLSAWWTDAAGRFGLSLSTPA